MAKRTTSSLVNASDKRDETQRSLGCVGVSAIAHVGLLIVVALAPSFKTQTGEKAGTQAGLEFAGVETANATPATSPGRATENKSELTEVMLADANDPNAVALPAAQRPPQLTPQLTPQVTAQTPPKAKAKIAKQVATAAAKSSDIAQALKAARAQSALAKAATPAIAKPVAANDEDQMPTNEPAQDDADDEQDATTQQGSAVVKNDVKNDVTKNVKKEDDAVPIQIAIPESEALTTEQENALQAPPTQMPATSGTLQGTSRAAGIGAGQGPAAAASRGGGASYSVPLGAPVRDARSLIAMSGNPKPVYPLQDKIAGRQGTAVLVAKVKQDGTVENVTLEKTSGSKMMDDSAAAAFRSWKYQPGQEGYVRLPVQFLLVGDAKIIPAQLKRQ